MKCGRYACSTLATQLFIRASIIAIRYGTKSKTQIIQDSERVLDKDTYNAELLLNQWLKLKQKTCYEEVHHVICKEHLPSEIFQFALVRPLAEDFVKGPLCEDYSVEELQKLYRIKTQHASEAFNRIKTNKTTDLMKLMSEKVEDVDSLQ